MIVQTLRLLRRVQAGLKSADASVQDAAESCLSFTVRHLRDDSLKLPAELVPLYERLPDPAA
jgi:hypothetical protein